MSRHASHRFLIALVLVGGVAFAQGGRREPIPANLKTGFESIETKSAEEILKFLAGPECEGRDTGSRGYEVAAQYVADRLKEFGVQPGMPDGTYFQMVPFTRRRASETESYLEMGDVRLTCGKEVTFWPFDGDVEHSLVFVQAGSEGKLEDSKPLRGAIVILNTTADYLSPIMGQIRRERPKAIIKVVETIGAVPSSVDRPRREVWGAIDRKSALRLATLGGVPDRLLKAAGDKADARAAVTRIPGRLVVKTISEEVGVPNVVGVLPGSDPTLKDEYVICGAHLDHLGVQEDGAIRYGADDDGSGSTGLLLLARALAKNPEAPRRSVMFLFFCAEEKGLIGSKYYCDHPTVPHAKVVCELQMDMIGRNEEKKAGGRQGAEKASDNVRTMHLVGSERLSLELHQKILAANRHIGFEFEYDEESVYTRSDHYNFARVGIPVAFLFSGFHPDYHMVTDTVEKINFVKLTDTARLVYLVVHSVANQTARLRLDGKDQK